MLLQNQGAIIKKKNIHNLVVKINIFYRRFIQQLQLNSPSTNSFLHMHCSSEKTWVIHKTEIL